MKRLALIVTILAFVLVFFYLNRRIVDEVEEVQPPVATAALSQKEEAPAAPMKISEDLELPIEPESFEPSEESPAEPPSSEDRPVPSPASQKIIYETPTNDVILVQ